MHRHIPPFALILPISKQLIHEILPRETPLHKHARLSILREHHVFFLQRRCGSNACSFLALARHVKTQSALALRVEHDYVHNGYLYHVDIHFDRKVIRCGGEFGIDYVTFGRHDPVGGNRGVGGGVLECEG